MKRLQIILDSDGVLAEPIKKVLILYNKEYKDNLKYEDITDWDLCKFQKEGSDICKYFRDKNFFRDLPVIFEAQIYVKKLIDDGHDVIIATASHKNGVIDKFDWFEEYFPFVKYENIIPISRKDLLLGDVMLDDGGHNLLTSKCKYPVVFDSPWNRNKELDKFIRVTSWEIFYNLVCSISNKEEKAS